MPANLLHGPSLPVTAPKIEDRERRRRLPEELELFKRDESAIGRALMTLADEIFSPDPLAAERKDTFNRRISEAINQTAQAAFTPMTTISYLTADTRIDDTAWVDLAGLEQQIVVPIPARVHLVLNLILTVTTPSNRDVFLRIWDGATARAAATIRSTATLPATFQWSVTLQDMFDAEPETLYTLTPQGSVAVLGPVLDALTGGSNNFCTFTVRVEPRSLVEE